MSVHGDTTAAGVIDSGAEETLAPDRVVRTWLAVFAVSAGFWFAAGIGIHALLT